jgi:hypothetical protein
VMVLLPGNVKVFKRAVRANPDRWGWLITPRRSMSRTLHTIPGAMWAADNECFTLGDDFDPARYLCFLWRNARIADKCLFATAPDVLGDARATLARAGAWLRAIRDLGMPAALVAQDGLESLPVPWGCLDALFIGGTTEWKLGPEARWLIDQAKQHGKWVHVGRVNSRIRLEYCIKLGVDSVDGTEWAINPGRGIRWASSVMSQYRLQRSLPL